MSNHAYEYIEKIKDELSNTKEITETIYKNVLDFISSTDTSPIEIENVFENLAICSDTIHKKIFFFTVSISIRHSARVFESLLDLILNNRDTIEMNTMNYLYWQFVHYIFSYPELNSINIKSKVWRILNFNISRYESIFSDLLLPIPANERNEDFVLVLTDQFLSYLHGPSKTAADRCKILMEVMNKKVLLLNSGEAMSTQGKIPFFKAFKANYNSDLLNASQIEWKSCKIPFFQCENIMPDPEIIRIILSMVRRQRPSYVITIGTGGIVAPLISKIIPTLSIGLLPSGISITGIPFQTLSRPLNDNDRDLLDSVGMSENSIIIGTFGSSILEQTSWYTRDEVGLPSEVWLAALVGGRLDQELDNDFWDMAEKASQYELEYVIIGTYSQSNLARVESAHPALKGKIHNIGFVTDVLSYLDLCDLYLNPIRSGGGTSCVEALSVGIPVITTPFGDVSVNVGNQFQTESYDSMVGLIKKYTSDFEFYKSQSILAQKRASKLLNSEDSFIKIISEFNNRSNHLE